MGLKLKPLEDRVVVEPKEAVDKILELITA